MNSKYYIDIVKTVNQLTPHYLTGRKLLLFLYATLQPLQDTINSFCAWAKETSIEANMTSQVIMLAWYINHKLGKYYTNSEDTVIIEDGASRKGVGVWNETAQINSEEHFVASDQDVHDQSALYQFNEKLQYGDVSFVVHLPEINTEKITITEIRHMLVFIIEKYKLATKTYQVKILNE